MKNKVSYKLIVLILFISISITTISTYIHVKSQYKERITRFEKSLDNIEKNQIPLLSETLWKVDYVMAGSFLENLINSRKIVYAELLDDGKIIKKVGVYKDVKTIKKEFNIIKKIDNDVYNIGKLIIIADLEPLYKDLENTVKGIIFTELIKMFLLSILIIVAMKKLLTNPLEKVADYAKKLSFNNLEKPFSPKAKEKEEYNELDLVLDSLNIMRKNLKNQIKENEEKNFMLIQQSKQAVMGEMIGFIVHQWKQPLNLISMSNGLLKFRQEDKSFASEEDVNTSLKNIDNAVKHLSSTMDDFRSFFKPNKEKIHFNIVNTFNKVFRLLDKSFVNYNIELVKEFEDIEIYGFENELIQVVINILNNARDALKTKKNQRLLIFIKVFSKDEKVNIYIKDNAGGIPDEIIGRVFESYFTTKNDTEGTGIGLYMSKKIISKNMKGDISVQNVNFIYEDCSYIGAEFKIVIDKKTDTGG